MKKGISLIVLSITILVMAILAATAIVALEDSGIIGRAKNVTKNSNYSDEYTRLVVIKNGILTDNIGTITVDEYIAELLNKGIIEENVIENVDGSRIVTTKTGFEVIISQTSKTDLNISINGNNSIPETPMPNTISFKVRHGTNSENWNDATDVIYTYTAEPGMTWEEFAESEYNDGKIYVSNVYMKSSLYNCPDYITTTIGDGSNGTIYGIKVEVDDVIVDGATYGGECD